MIDKLAAIKLVRDYLDRTLQEPEHPKVVVDEQSTIKTRSGWVYFYQSEKFLTTGEIDHALVGTAPIIVRKNDGALFLTGTAKPVEEYIKEFESGNDI